MYINSVTIYGNLTRDVELKALPSGIQVANFGVATNRNYKDKDGNKKEEVEFHNLVAFGRTAEVIAQYMKKGSAIYVEGRLQTRSWEKDGQKFYRTEIVVNNFQFGARSQGTQVQAQENAPQVNPEQSGNAPQADHDFGIPF